MNKYEDLCPEELFEKADELEQLAKELRAKAEEKEELEEDVLIAREEVANALITYMEALGIELADIDDTWDYLTCKLIELESQIENFRRMPEDGFQKLFGNTWLKF